LQLTAFSIKKEFFMIADENASMAVTEQETKEKH
jgi:hypothetical protein